MRDGALWINGEAGGCGFFAHMYEMWSAEKYGVYGITTKAPGASGHVGFYPEANNYSSTVYFDYN
jgi:hypothetical protein